MMVAVASAGSASSGVIKNCLRASVAPLITAAVNHNWPVVLPLNDEKGLWFYATAQDERMLQELKRVLKKDGFLIISTPDKQHYSDESSFHNNFHEKSSL